MSSPAVAVAVVSWNTRELLARCLDSLEPEVAAGRAEAIVVDNGSTDGSPDLVRREYTFARLIELNENLGYGSAVNRAARDMSAPWIAPANADVALEPGALEALVAAGGRSPDVGIVAPRLITPDGSTQHSVHPFPTLAVALLHGLGLTAVVPRLGDRLTLEGGWNPERRRTVDWAHGAFLLVRRRAFDALRGFDETHWMYAEDLDLCWRASRAGWRTLYEPAARVRHELSAAATQAFAEERHQRHVIASYAWMLRRRGPWATRSYALASVAGAAIRAAAYTPLARIAPSRFARRAATCRRWTRLHLIGLRSREKLASAC